MQLFANTIQRKLLLLLLAVGLIPAVLAVLHVHWGTLIGLDSMLGGFLQEHARQAAASTDESLTRYFHAAGALLEAADEGRLAGAAQTPSGRMFQTVAVVDAQGNSVGEFSPSPEPRFQLPAAVRGDGAPEGIFLHEETNPGAHTSRLLFIGRLPGEPLRLLVSAVETSRVLEQGAIELHGRGGSLSIHSNRGLAIAGQELPRELVEAARIRLSQSPIAGWIGDQEHEPSRILTGYATSNLLRTRRSEGLTSVDWIILSRMNLADATALYSYLLWRSLLFGLILVPVLIVLSYWLTRRFLRPVRHLHDQVDRLAAGDLGARVHIGTGDELENLGRAFNEMARGLDLSQAALEEQVRMVEGKARQLSLIHNITSAMIAAFDLPRLFRTAHEQLSALIAHEGMAAVIFEADPSGASVYEVAGRVFSTGEAALVRFYCEERFARSETARMADPGRYDPGRAAGGMLPPAGPPEEDAPVEVCWGEVCLLPLRAEQGLIGALALARADRRQFSETELRTLVQIGQVLAIAVEHIRLYEKTRGFAAELEHKVAERAAQLERAQDKLIQAERFAATGRLAAGIAHEINNPLGILKNYLRILRDTQPGPDSSAAGVLTILNEELDRIARIVRNLLYFYRPSAQEHTALDLNGEIQILLALMDAGFRRRRIQVQTDLEADLPRPVVAPDHIRQVLLNLLKNAEDAVADEGRIRLTTRCVEDANGRPELLLQVSDNGCGIAPENLPHVFEPFFTSKRDGQGTGLGLSVTYGIIQNLNGTIEVDSRPGGGTTVNVRIPAESRPIAVPAG